MLSPSRRLRALAVCALLHCPTCIPHTDFFAKLSFARTCLGRDQLGHVGLVDTTGEAEHFTTSEATSISGLLDPPPPRRPHMPRPKSLESLNLKRNPKRKGWGYASSRQAAKDSCSSKREPYYSHEAPMLRITRLRLGLVFRAWFGGLEVGLGFSTDVQDTTQRVGTRKISAKLSKLIWSHRKEMGP